MKGKTVFVNFWVLSCAPCKAELPSVNRLAAHYRGDTDVVVLSVSLDYNFAEANGYLAKQKLDLKVYNPVGSIPSVFFGGVMPTTVVVSKQGVIVFRRDEEGDYSSATFVSYMDSVRRL